MEEQIIGNGMEDALLPDGWSEGEDLFAPEGTDPTTEAPEGSVSPAGAEETAPRTYRLKVNHEEKEVTLSEEEVVARLQKSYAFDAMKERREGTRDLGAEVFCRRKGAGKGRERGNGETAAFRLREGNGPGIRPSPHPALRATFPPRGRHLF